jgi:hypothetical protein
LDPVIDLPTDAERPGGVLHAFDAGHSEAFAMRSTAGSVV